jgi:cell pole-organizing protein PopZ
MAKPGLAQDQTVEEILASIRQVINGEQSRTAADGVRPVSPRPYANSVTPIRGGSVVDAEEPADQIADSVAEPTPEAPVSRAEMHDVIELAIEQALDGVNPEQTRAEKASFGAATSGGTATRPSLGSPIQPQAARELSRRAEALPRQAPPTAGGLLSPRANAAVAASFDELARVLEDRGVRQIDRAVEDLLRPMLKRWLEDNLPSLVERLVREEIERVSRGRR